MTTSLLITGGAGFIGANLVHLAVERGFSVVTLDVLNYAASRASLTALEGHTHHHFIHGSIGDRELIDRLLAKHNPAAILNLAAETHVDRSIDDPSPFVATNVVGTFTLLEAVRTHMARLTAAEAASFRFLHVSTDEVYGSADGGAFTETSPTIPSSPYAASKAGGDALVRSYGKTYGLPILVTHGCNSYGPYQFPEKFVPLTILNCIEENPIPLYGDGKHVREWLHARDHAAALLAVLAKGVPGESYNVGSGAAVPNVELAGKICALMDRLRPRGKPYRSLMEHVADRPGHDRRYALNATKLANTTGWGPELALDAGLERTVRWYMENEAWWRETRQRYHGQRLGLSTGTGG